MLNDKIEYKDETPFLQNMGLLLISMPFTLYYTLLHMIAWNWFLSDKFFVIGYWEMLLVGIVLRFIVLKNSSNFKTLLINKKVGFPTMTEKFAGMFAVALTNTLSFGVLYIIHLMISYYS